MGGLYNLQTFFGVYNFIVNTSKQVLFLPPSDAYVRSFLYLLYTLIILYYTHTHKKNSSRDILPNSVHVVNSKVVYT